MPTATTELSSCLTLLVLMQLPLLPNSIPVGCRSLLNLLQPQTTSSESTTWDEADSPSRLPPYHHFYPTINTCTTHQKKTPFLQLQTQRQSQACPHYPSWHHEDAPLLENETDTLPVSCTENNDVGNLAQGWGNLLDVLRGSVVGTHHGQLPQSRSSWRTALGDASDNQHPQRWARELLPMSSTSCWRSPGPAPTYFHEHWPL